MHIKFYETEIWEKWRGNYESDPDSFIVDLRGASSQDEILNRLRGVLKAVKCPTATPFLGLDALDEALSDFFCERWNQKTRVYVLGWKEIMEKFPMLSQKIICVFYGSYCGCIWEIARAVAEGEKGIDKSRIHENIFDGVRVFMILN